MVLGNTVRGTCGSTGPETTQRQLVKYNQSFLLHCACVIPHLEGGFEQEGGWPLAAEVQVIVLTATTVEYVMLANKQKIQYLRCNK